MTETKKIYQWWWPWQTEKIERMLEEMASQGWMLKRAGAMMAGFTFEKREPACMRYCLDYQEKEKPEYLALLQDAGWRMLHKNCGWYIWCMAYEGERPELYTDVDSLIRRSNAILGSLTAVFAGQIPLMTVNMQNIWSNTPMAVIFIAAWVLIVAVLGGTIIGTALGIRKLKRRKNFALGK